MQRVTLAMAVLLTPAMAHAQDIEVPLGTLALRSGFTPEISADVSEFDLKSTSTLIDWYPSLGGFHLSGGLRVAANSIDLGASPALPVTVGGTSYTPAQVGRLSGSVEFNRFAPYLGIGWQGAMMGGRMLIGLDFGAMYQGNPDVRLSASGADANPALADDLAHETNAIEEKYSGFRFSPVISLSFTYRF